MSMNDRATNNNGVAEEISVQTASLRLSGQAWGPKTGRPVLALHGWMDNSSSFALLAPLLRGIRLVALDLPGHGRSAHRPAGSAYHFVDYIPDVLAAADGLGWQTFSLLGHSLGAGISTITAAVAPNRVTHLALIEGLGPVVGDPADAPKALSRFLEQANRLKDKPPGIYRNMREAVIARRTAGDISIEAARLLVERNGRAVDAGFTWRSDPRLRQRSPAYLSELQVHAYLAEIQAPTLLVRGESGFLVERSYIPERCARVANLTVEHLPGKHHLHMDDPEPVAGLLNEFFASPDAGAP